MADCLQHYRDDLRTLEARGRLRRLAPRAGRDFASNDYLALADHPALRSAIATALERGVPIGAGGSRLLRGNHPEHEKLEAEAAAFFGSEKALFFGGGYLANFALFSLLPQPDDLVVHDALVHASCHEGMRAGRAARVVAAHNEPEAFDAAIRQWRINGGMGRPWIAVESLYSMDGDAAPLAALMEVADRHDAMLVVDEAHATGVLGPDGRGLGAAFEGRSNVITLHTCGKALGASGALVCAPALLVDYLINRSRPFIFATAPSPLMAVAVGEALRICRREPPRRERLAKLVAFANQTLEQRCGIRGSGSHIMPVVIGEDEPTMQLAEALQAQGYDIRGIRPPTVPTGTSRLRISLTLNVDEAVVDRMLSTLAELKARFKA